MKLKAILTGFLFLITGTIMGQTTLTIDGSQKGPQINSSLYGLFFEEINHAGDGGIYAELIRNRSFEDNANKPEAWHPVGSAQINLFTKGLLNKVQGEALHVNIPSGTNMKFHSGVSNEGFWGINAVNGRTYTLNLWIQSPKGYHGRIAATLQSADGTKIYARTILNSIGKSWKKFTATITCNSNDNAAHLALLFDHPGTVDIDMSQNFELPTETRFLDINAKWRRLVFHFHSVYNHLFRSGPRKKRTQR